MIHVERNIKDRQMQVIVFCGNMKYLGRKKPQNIDKTKITANHRKRRKYTPKYEKIIRKEKYQGRKITKNRETKKW